MMKLILFVLFRAIFSVQSKITTTKTLIKAGDPFTLECDKPTERWTFNGKTIAHCQHCPSSTCYVHQDYRKRITVFCKRNKSVLHFISTQIGYKDSVKCPWDDSASFQLLVGSYNAHLRSENNSTFALNQNDYTLVCDKEKDGEIIWYNGQAEILSYFGKDCSNEHPKYDAKRFDITCDAKQKKAKFHIKNVTLSEDGQIIGCKSAGLLYLFSLTVNVPVTSVSIQSQSQVLLENEDGIFVCKVEESKPEASFQWIVYKDGSAQEIQQKSNISKTLKGKLWQTTSTLKLNIKRDYQKIMCKATIENMPWTNSEYQSLDIKFPVSIQSQSQVLHENEDGIFVCKVEESKPEASFQWIIVYKNGSSQEIQQKSIISKTLKGKLWQTTSTLKLNMKSDYQKIMCNATIENMPWTNSEYQSLDIKYHPIIKMNDTITVIENETNVLNCSAEGNPKPTIKWIIGHNIVKSKLLKVSFTRNNETAVQCIATANSTKHGILESSKNISIFVTYSPEITIRHNVTRLQQNAQISCTAQASPNKIQYKMVQKWANTEKKNISAKQQNFRNFSFQDLGNWICLASNDVPTKGYYSKKSVEIKVNVSAQFKGDKNETAMVGSKKRLKTCFYCYPEATEVKWYKGNEEMSSDRISYVTAADGQFPFTGNCSILELDITEKEIQIYYLNVTNPVGKRTFEFTLDSGIPADSPIYIIVSCVIAVFVIIIIIGGIVYVKFRRSSKKNQSNIYFSNPANNLRSSEGHEYANIYDVPRSSGQPTGNEIPYDDRPMSQRHEYANIYDVPRSSGQPTGNEIAMSQNHTYENEPFYIDVINTPIRTGHALTAESEYTIMYNVPRSSGQPTGNVIPYDDIAMSQNHTYENEPFYIDVTNAPIRTGHALTAESEYTIMYNVPRSSGQPTGNEIPYDDIAMSQNHTYENEPFYIDVTNAPIRTGHLD